MFNISNTHVILIIIAILMGFYYVRGKLTPEMQFLGVAVALAVFLLSKTEQNLIDLDDALELTRRKSLKHFQDGMLEGEGMPRVVLDAELKKILGTEKGVTMIMPYKFCVPVVMTSGGNPDVWYIYEWSKFGNFQGIRRLKSPIPVKDVFPELLVLSKEPRVSSEVDKKQDGDNEDES